MDKFFSFLAENLVITLFLVMALGYLLGRVKLRGFSLGVTPAIFIIGLFISMVAASTSSVTFAIPPLAQAIFFNLFIYAIGLRVGPQFFTGLQRDGWRFVVLTLIVSGATLLLALGMSWLLDLPAGSATGLLASTIALGPAQKVIAEGTYRSAAQVPPDQLSANLMAAFALTYILAVVVFVVFLRYLPRMFGRNPVQAARQAEAEARSSGAAPLPGSEEAFVTNYLVIDERAYRVQNPELVGRSVSDLGQVFPDLALERLKRQGDMLALDDHVVLQLDDVIGVSGPVGELARSGSEIGPEVDDGDVRAVTYETSDVVVSRAKIVGQSLEALREVGYGLYLNAMFRMGEEIPITPTTVVKRGDVLRLTGSTERVTKFARLAGTVVRSQLATDLLTLALGMVAGLLLGLISVSIFGLTISLSSAGGLLLAGIVIGTMRSINPALGGPVPESARQILEDLGLNLFMVMLGLTAGPNLAGALGGKTLVPLLVSGAIVTLLPGFLGWLAGLFFYRMNVAVLMGTVAGARGSTIAMRTAQEESQSIVPAIGYPVPYALSRVLVATWGLVTITLS